MSCPDSKINLKTFTPEQACNLTDSQKRDYFDEYLVAHERVLSVKERLLRMALPSSGYNILLLIGPTGVGKTTVLEALEETVLEQCHEEMMTDQSLIPVIGIKIPEPGTRQFAWSTYYTEMLAKLNDPIVLRRLQAIGLTGATGLRQSTAHGTVQALQQAFMKLLEARRTRVVIVDEAAHLLGHFKGDDLTNLTNALKYMANEKTVMVLAGSYDLLALMGISGQLSRRICVIHFERYQEDNEADRKAFRLALQQLQESLPLESTPDYLTYADALQHVCAGCVGILKGVFKRALAKFMEDRAKGKASWTLERLEEALLAQETLKHIRKEALEGEDNIQKHIQTPRLLSRNLQETHSSGVAPKRTGRVSKTPMPSPIKSA